MRPITFRERLRYRFDNTMARGPAALIAWLGVLSVILIAFISAVVVATGLDPDKRGFMDVAWGGLIGPANMPKDIVTRLNAEIRTALANPAVKERFRVLGSETDPSTPEEFRELSRRETEKWARVIKLSGAKVD